MGDGHNSIMGGGSAAPPPSSSSLQFPPSPSFSSSSNAFDQTRVIAYIAVGSVNLITIVLLIFVVAAVRHKKFVDRGPLYMTVSSLVSVLFLVGWLGATEWEYLNNSSMSNALCWTFECSLLWSLISVRCWFISLSGVLFLGLVFSWQLDTNKIYSEKYVFFWGTIIPIPIAGGIAVYKYFVAGPAFWCNQFVPYDGLASAIALVFGLPLLVGVIIKLFTIKSERVRKMYQSKEAEQLLQMQLRMLRSLIAFPLIVCACMIVQLSWFLSSKIAYGYVVMVTPLLLITVYTVIHIPRIREGLFEITRKNSKTDSLNAMFKFQVALTDEDEESSGQSTPLSPSQSQSSLDTLRVPLVPHNNDSSRQGGDSASVTARE
ncbi:hypothetical protein Pelo_9464 [Pelomyxa schiedti]|nr:hypothetical protein Pelo_9464 [Pelomyxa schiedti]